MNWQDALCRQVDSGELFHPEKGGSVREAKEICHRCPLEAECLQFALEHEERFGVWGGASETERRQMLGRPRRGRAA